MQILKEVALKGLFALGAPVVLRRIPAQSSKLIVLAYHSVSDDLSYALPGIRITPALFAQQIKYLTRNYHVVDLSEAIEIHCSGEALPERAIAITFDDGYEDNNSEAFPVLQAYKAPATIFATVGPCLENSRFWVSWLYEALFHEVHTEAIKLVFGVQVPAEVESAFNEISKILNYCGAAQRKSLLDHYADAANVPERPRRMLNIEQMLEMQRGGIRFGSHTLTHPILANIDEDERSFELRESRSKLAAALERDVGLIAYPNGRSIPHNFDDSVVRDCKAAGYDAAFTSQRRPLTANDSPHAIPRMGVSQTGGLARFAVSIERFRLRKPQTVPEVSAGK